MSRAAYHGTRIGRDRRTSVELTDCVRVTIRNDQELLLALLDAIVKGDVPLPLRGGYSDGSTGSGESTFEAATRPQLEAWFAARGVKL